MQFVEIVTLAFSRLCLRDFELANMATSLIERRQLFCNVWV